MLAFNRGAAEYDRRAREEMVAPLREAGDEGRAGDLIRHSCNRRSLTVHREVVELNDQPRRCSGGPRLLDALVGEAGLPGDGDHPGNVPRVRVDRRGCPGPRGRLFPRFRPRVVRAEQVGGCCLLPPGVARPGWPEGRAPAMKGQCYLLRTELESTTRVVFRILGTRLPKRVEEVCQGRSSSGSTAHVVKVHKKARRKEPHTSSRKG